VALEEARDNETSAVAREVLQQLIDNAHVAASEQLPLCQDTGLTVVFVEQGADLLIESDPASDVHTLFDAVQAGVKQGYDKGYLRKSMVSDPLVDRWNTGTNTPAVIHYCLVPGNTLRITLMAKGGGCENRSQFCMFRPTAERQEVMDWIIEVARTAGADACPPLIVGVGMGGDFEQSCILSKKALLRDLRTRHTHAFYARLEQDLLSEINDLNIGPQGFGGKTTALAVLIETAPCHIASLPVAVNIECHSHRHKTVEL
jgi:fumarate hydratase subunit alpha